jgi:hypothetical protein
MTASHRLTAATARNTRPCARCLHWTLKALAQLAGGAALACALLLMPDPAQAVNDDAVLRRMDAVLEENTRLRDEAWKARKQGRDAAKQAEDAANASDERLERTRIEALAHVAGVSPAQVESLRKDGKSWGQAAGELGVHPGFLGIGKAPLYQSLPTSKAPEKKMAAKGKKGKKGQEKVQAKGKRAVEKAAPAAKSAKKTAKAAPAKKTASDKKTKKSKQKT